MTIAPQLKKHRGLIASLAAIAAIIIGAVIYGGAAGTLTSEPQQLRVVITGNLGARVTVDGEVRRLDAPTGVDSSSYPVKKSISVFVTSTGDAPSCKITDGSGKILADQSGPAPERVEQTVGWAPDVSVINAPTYENASCGFTVP